MGAIWLTASQRTGAAFWARLADIQNRLEDRLAKAEGGPARGDGGISTAVIIAIVVVVAVVCLIPVCVLAILTLLGPVIGNTFEGIVNEL